MFARRAFGLFYTLSVTALVMIPAFWLGSDPPILNKWYEENPVLFSELGIPILLTWVASLFVYRWLMCKLYNYIFKER